MNQYEPREIGLRAEALRRRLGISQQELANRCDISQQFISRAETGTSGMKLASLYKLANALETTVNFLLTGKQEIEVERLSQQELANYLHDRIQYNNLTINELLLLEDVIEAIMNYIRRKNNE